MTRKRMSLVGAGLLALAGCSPHSTYHGSYEGYSVKITKSISRRTVLTIYAPEKDGGKICAVDWEGNNRFDSVELQDLPEGHKLEALANTEIVGEIFRKVTEESGKNEEESGR